MIRDAAVAEIVDDNTIAPTIAVTAVPREICIILSPPDDELIMSRLRVATGKVNH